MLPIHLALVSTVSEVSIDELSVVSAALQKQIVRDFTPIWQIEGTIDVFTTIESVPLGYWPIFVVDTVDQGGQHRDRNQQPFALVAAGTSWSLAASHETLEMLVDPFGNRLVAGNSPMAGQGRVEFLVEICDPCQDDDFAYNVNGVLVSDFYTPNYFDPVAASGVRYSFNGAIKEPREVLSGGYLTWREPITGDWFQKKRFLETPEFKNLGPLSGATDSIRARINELTPEKQRLSKLDQSRPSMQRTSEMQTRIKSATTARANQLNEQLAQLKSKH
jgi:hypothetical protein